MKIYDQNKQFILSEIDLGMGYLKDDKIFVRHHDAIPAVEGQGHREVIKEYPNGSKDVQWVWDIEPKPAVAAYDEYENIQVFIPYTDEEKAQMAQSKKQNRIDELKSLLASTDYKAIKYAEGEITAVEYAETKAQRRAWRAEINSLGG